MELKVLDKKGKAGKAITVSDELFAVPVKAHLVHESVVCHLANLRTGNASTKNRKLVRGGGRKPWKQKGTGRARSGSSRSPVWVGGGTTFGPTPRSYSYELPKKIARGALASAISAKVANGSLKVVETIEVAEPKTKAFRAILDGIGVTGNALVIVAEKNQNLVLASRNLAGVKLISVNNINVYDLVRFETVIATKEAVMKLEEGVR